MKEAGMQSDTCFLEYIVSFFFVCFSLILCTISNFGKTRATDDVKATKLKWSIFYMLPYSRLKIYSGNLSSNAPRILTSPTPRLLPSPSGFPLPFSSLFPLNNYSKRKLNPLATELWHDQWRKPPWRGPGRFPSYQSFASVTRSCIVIKMKNYTSTWWASLMLRHILCVLYTVISVS